MTPEIQNKLNIWAGQFHESKHPKDYERFYEVVIQSYKDDYRLSGDSIQEVLKTAGKLNSQLISELSDYYSDLYHHLYNLLEFNNSPR
ncbi:hypothetical protein [Cyclobacterium sp.]|uniref:hypothetical protein n=1 Tax=Cyclobacterium sp. TaxID=1966343 RepID=UPI0019B90698|nr:hypothetical protein [Cyclobacterium sp.]MBD3630985.1 hypothetical protein [Cyclobacterium sp.]